MATVILLRKLTRKSTLKYGKYKDYTVQHLLNMRLRICLISSYFKLSTITFTDDILDELGITEEFRIPKPSKDRELYRTFLIEKYGTYKQPRREELEKMKRETVSYRKGLLMSVNHGK